MRRRTLTHMSRAALVVIALICACATEGGFRELADRRVGLSEDELVRDMGPPHAQFQRRDGGRILTWEIDHGSVAVPVGTIAVARRRVCRVSFDVSERGAVTGYTFTGWCRA